MTRTRSWIFSQVSVAVAKAVAMDPKGKTVLEKVGKHLAIWKRTSLKTPMSSGYIDPQMGSSSLVPLR